MSCTIPVAALKPSASFLSPAFAYGFMVFHTRLGEVCFLWIQSQVQAKKLMVRKIPGDKNPVDILTKPKFLKEMKVHLEKLNVYVNLKTIDRDQVVEGC